MGLYQAGLHPQRICNLFRGLHSSVLDVRPHTNKIPHAERASDGNVDFNVLCGGVEHRFESVLGRHAYSWLEFLHTRRYIYLFVLLNTL